jgi:thiamine kinase-like enzyme
VKRAEQRWAAYLDGDAARNLLAGEALLHTDFNPLNILIGAGTAWIIDWAWPTRGAAFIDPACLLLRLMLDGHTAAEAEAWAAQCDSWAAAPGEAIDTFALACARLYGEIARADPQPWKQCLAAAGHDWARHRNVGGLGRRGQWLAG